MICKQATINTIVLFALFLALVSTGCQSFTPIQEMRTGGYRGSIRHGGLRRTYNIHIPNAHDGTEPVPLVISLHGRAHWGREMERLTRKGFNELAEKDVFVVVYPDGTYQHWHDGSQDQNFFRNFFHNLFRPHTEKADDVGFISALIDHLDAYLNIDRKRVYVVGASNGGMMAYRLACELSDEIAAIAPVVGTMPVNVSGNCSPSRPVPVLLIHGTDDPISPWDGGEVAMMFGKALSVRETVDYWIAHNKCSTVPTITLEPDNDPKDGTRVWREVYSGGEEGSEVILYVIEGGGHSWPSGHQFSPRFISGKKNNDIDANRIIWEFFKRHAIK